MTQPCAYVITQRKPHHPVLAQCLQSLEQYSWPYQLFAATDGYSVTDQAWSDQGVRMLADRGKMQHRPGAQGCWHSHFRLWQRAAEGETLIVLEHDVLVKDPWDPTILEEDPLVKLYATAKTKVNAITGTWSIGAHAYLLTPKNADRLITHARRYGAQALDKHLGDQVVPWRFWHRDLVVLNPRRGASTTSPLGKLR